MNDLKGLLQTSNWYTILLPMNHKPFLNSIYEIDVPENSKKKAWSFGTEAKFL